MLVVDMPPGTGDVSISLGQLLPRAEVVVVTTPQQLAQDVAARAASMAQKTNMRLLGVIENMSGDVFGSGGGEELAADLGVPLLGTVPLDPVLREQGDAGAPVVSARPEAESAQRDRRDRAGDRGAAPRARRHPQVAAAREPTPVDVEEGLPRLRSLGFGEADAQELWAHFDGAEQRVRRGTATRGSRPLEGLEGYDPSAQPSLVEHEEGLSAGTEERIGYLVFSGASSAPARPARRSCPSRRVPGTFPTGMLGHHVRRLAGLGWSSTRPPPRRARLRHPPNTPSSPARTRLPLESPAPAATVVVDVSMGA